MHSILVSVCFFPGPAVQDAAGLRLVALLTLLSRLLTCASPLLLKLPMACTYPTSNQSNPRLAPLQPLGRVFGLPLPAGPLTAIFFLPNSRWGWELGTYSGDRVAFACTSALA